VAKEGKMRGFTKVPVVLVALLCAGAAMAAGIDGTWVGTVGESQITFELKADGNKLTGTLDNAAAPGATEIRDGKVNGDEVSFTVVRSLNNAETAVPWTGKLVGDELRLQRGAVAGNAAAEVVAKRAARQ
jgi:hypothetical protein